MKSTQTNPHENSEVWLSTKRIETLVDGIFAIAMTLLVLSLTLPQLTSPVTNQAISQTLWGMSQQFFTYALSFILLAIFWRINHSQFYLIKKSNQALVWINIVWLLFVALIPFSTNLISDYGYLTVPMIFFNMNLFIIGILYSVNWYYADRKHFIDESMDQESIDSRKKLNLALPVLALIAIGLSFIIPAWCTLVYFGMFLIKRAIE